MINNSCGRQKEAGQDEQVSVQGDDLTMLSDELIPDVPSDYSGLHPADALLLVSDAKRLGPTKSLHFRLQWFRYRPGRCFHLLWFRYRPDWCFHLR